LYLLQYLYDDEEEEYEGDYRSQNLLPPKIADFEFEPQYPELEDLVEFDKLKVLAMKVPQSAFNKFFNPDIEDLDLKSKIRHVNYLESVFDTFIKFNVGNFDWDAFRKYLKISVPADFDNVLFQEIEDVFLANMRGHNYKNLPRKTARRLWAETVYLTDGNLKPMTKPFSWAAGIECLVGSLLFDQTPMDIMEIDYQISSPTIRKRMEQLCEILNIKVFSYPFHKLYFPSEDVLF